MNRMSTQRVVSAFTRRTKKVYGWSYAGLLHPMNGLHRHIGGSVGSHLPMKQQHAESWRSGHRRQPAVGTGEQASHEQVWCVTLALATIKGMVDRPNDRSIQVCEELDPSPPSCYAAAPTSWWLWSPADAVSIWAVWVVGCHGLYRVHTHASPAVSCLISAQWG